MKKFTVFASLISALMLCLPHAAFAGQLDSLPKEPEIVTAKTDWLIDASSYKAAVYRTGNENEIAISNGLVRRVFRISPNGATVGLDNLVTGESVIRGVKPEAKVTIDDKDYNVGGLTGQEEYGYLMRKWIDALKNDPASFQFVSFETGKTVERFPWKRKRYSADSPWPPPGVSLTLNFRPPEGGPAGLLLSVHYELYDGIPLVSKWFTLRNDGSKAVRINRFVSEVLAAVEYEALVDVPEKWEAPNIHVETDYAFASMSVRLASKLFWVPDTQYTSQVNYDLKTPVLLETRPALGPDMDVKPSETFESFRAYELIYDSTERERKGLELRRMYRTIAPWVTENPIMMHITMSDVPSVRKAIDQAAATGFEMVIISFWSGFNAENDRPEYINMMKSLAAYAHKKGIELGGYSLLASRSIDEENDVINPATMKTHGAFFGDSPCLGSKWGEKYFRTISDFYAKTGFDILENDGSYPGDVCASTKHPGHRGLADSQWTQWKKMTDLYKDFRGRGIYLNVPDWYYLSGANKDGMGYREVNWSLPRDRQIMLGRQNIFDGTWEKTPGMGWMFVPLTQYHGGGESATIEPLKDHLDTYGAILAQNFGAGVQACYRGTRLYDTKETKEVVIKWVAFYKKYRAILDSDIIHIRRPDGRDIDGFMHVNPLLKEKGLAFFFNPLDVVVKKTISLQLYYTGLTDTANIREQDGPPRQYKLDRNYAIQIEVEIQPKSFTWFVVE